MPVPESPAKSAVIPRRRLLPPPMPHSPRTLSRWRARAVSSWSCASLSSGSTRSSQLATGSIRRASRSRPAAFWARAPLEMSATVIGRAAATVARRADCAARAIWSGASRNARVTTAGSNSTGRSPLSEPSHSSWRSAIVGHRRVEQQRRLARPRRIPRPVADEDHRRPALGEGAHRCRAAFGQDLDRPRDDAGAAQPGLAGGGGRDVARVRRSVPRRARSSWRTGRPSCCERRGGERSGRTRRRARARSTSGIPPSIARANRSTSPIGAGARLDEDVRDRGIRLVVAEQVRGHAIRDPQRAGQERPVRVLDEDEPARDEGAVRPEPDALRTARDAGRRCRRARARGRCSRAVARRRRGGTPYSRSKRGSRSGASATSRSSTSSGSRRNARASRRRRTSWPGRLRGVRGPIQRRERLDRGRRSTDPRSGRSPGSASMPSTWASEMYSPRNRSPGSGSSARRRSTALRTRASTMASRPSRYVSDGSISRRVGASNGRPRWLVAAAVRRRRIASRPLDPRRARGSSRPQAAHPDRDARRSLLVVADDGARRQRARPARRPSRSRRPCAGRDRGPTSARRAVDATPSVGTVSTGGPNGGVALDHDRGGHDDVERRLQLAAERRPDVREGAVLRRRLADVDVDRQVRLGERALSRSSGLIIGLRMNADSSADRRRCSSSGRWVQAVTRYDSLNRRGGSWRAVTVPSSSRASSQAGTRRWRSSRMSYRYRSTVGALRGRPSPWWARRTPARPASRSGRRASRASRGARPPHGSSGGSSARRASARRAAPGHRSGQPARPFGQPDSPDRVSTRALSPRRRAASRRHVRIPATKGPTHAEISVARRLRRGGRGRLAPDRGRRHGRRRLRRARRARARQRADAGHQLGQFTRRSASSSKARTWRTPCTATSSTAAALPTSCASAPTARCPAARRRSSPAPRTRPPPAYPRHRARGRRRPATRSRSRCQPPPRPPRTRFKLIVNHGGKPDGGLRQRHHRQGKNNVVTQVKAQSKLIRLEEVGTASAVERVPARG